MSVLNPNKAFAQGILGVAVKKATAALPADASSATLFTITGGRVVITSFLGKVTTALQAQANAVKLVYNPTAAGTSFDLCGATETNGDAVGQTYTFLGNVESVGSLLVAGAVGQSNPVFDKPLCLDNGTIEVNCADGGTGSVEWALTYVPLDDGAVVTAA